MKPAFWICYTSLNGDKILREKKLIQEAISRQRESISRHEVVCLGNALKHQIKLTQHFIHHQSPYKWTHDISLLVTMLHINPYALANTLDERFPTRKVTLS